MRGNLKYETLFEAWLDDQMYFSAQINCDGDLF